MSRQREEQEVMSADERGEFVKNVVTKYLLPVLSKKGRDYTEYDDRNLSVNSNFEDIANMLADSEIGKYQVWAVFFLKHVQSILSWISTGKLESEKLEGRLTDAINYLFIMWSMLVEDGIAENVTNEVTVGTKNSGEFKNSRG